ncbi:uncharacterized protein SCHCODRAFT_02252718 [Schizophyllum commune H4-8]|uniref:uncharacterized protein n=1 Tax=Schizophyllum commune (strain H4-8 / FGSC 9210) TaxID=578458 RepID=UPI00216053DF|nr:uncharacterized protein SCHCODRAFT_02252718 [Schizophyllum commune H4-8]KAI5893404.1 hypothetical protein SCHCODRAFT_02252718 [Schizophyllum commune H4-8]
MPCLRTIVLKMDMHKLLLYITAPRLATVTLVGVFLCEGDPTESLLDLLWRSQAPNRSFELQDPMNGSADMLLGCLERMEGLRRMKLENASSKAKKLTRMLHVLDRLACSEDRLPVLPELKPLCLHMRGKKLMKTAPSELIELVIRLRRSRAQPRTCAGRAVAVMEDFEANMQDLANMSF